MDNKDNKLGFSGLSNLTSDTRTVPQAQRQTSPQLIKRRFFEILERQLGVSDQPKMIGDLAQAHEHPKTGLPAKKKNSGCAPSDSFVYWHWWPGRLGADVHMRGLGMKFMCETEGGDTHGW